MATLAFLLFGLISFLDPVFGASCSSSDKCLSTKYTLATCDKDSKNCSCSSVYPGYKPIRSGCGRNLYTPTLKPLAPFSTEMIPGKEAVLICSSDDGATLFEWMKDGLLFKNVTTSMYTITAASVKDTGTYKCKAKLNTDSYFQSLESEGLTMTLITILDTPQPPVVLVHPTEIFPGKNANLDCSNLPNGFNKSKVIFLNGDSVPITTPLRMTSLLSETFVKCVLTDATLFTGTVSSGVQKLPKVVSRIIGVGISTTAVRNEVYTVLEKVPLACMTSPEPAYVDTTSTALHFGWMINSTVVNGQNEQTLNLPLTEGVYTITCFATYDGTALSSPAITITRSSSYFTKPAISPNPTIPVLGSLLTLACKSSYEGEYSWKKGTVSIPRQFDDILQMDNLTAADFAIYTCSIKRSTVIMTSDSFAVNIPDIGNRNNNTESYSGEQSTVKGLQLSDYTTPANIAGNEKERTSPTTTVIPYNGQVISMGSVLITGLMFLSSRLLL
ncbi:uncharacterized protein LOC129928511 [Biomphalaria glabrata]|uniref:Uncharacterized protein LOC129928511 n=1 Tax=Biomphalaria glabrata TaxID=6526 RepID=A0A9W3BHU2_BIOGL|nr:uncharacterized protein LOC129928511 [Biomphalaria glabrata]